MRKVLTISIAAYNVEKWLRKTLDSLIVESVMDDVEVLIVNDGSTDNTETIAKEYENKYPKTFRLINKENGGYGSTINRSVIEAKGKYFKQLDGDDWFYSGNLEQYINILKNTDADRVVTSFIRHNESTLEEKEEDCLPDLPEGLYDIEDITFKDYLNMHSSAFRTELLRKIPAITEHCFYTDLELTCYPVMLEKKYYVRHKPVYVYRIGREGQSVSIKSLCDHYKDHETVLKNLFKVYKKIDHKDRSRKKFLYIRLWIETLTHLKILCQLDNEKMAKDELIKFIVSVNKRYPEIINKCMSHSKIAKILIKSDFTLFKPVRFLLKRKNKTNLFA